MDIMNADNGPISHSCPLVMTPRRKNPLFALAEMDKEEKDKRAKTPDIKKPKYGVVTQENYMPRDHLQDIPKIMEQILVEVSETVECDDDGIEVDGDERRLDEKGCISSTSEISSSEDESSDENLLTGYENKDSEYSDLEVHIPLKTYPETSQQENITNYHGEMVDVDILDKETNSKTTGLGEDMTPTYEENMELSLGSPNKDNWNQEVRANNRLNPPHVLSEIAEEVESDIGVVESDRLAATSKSANDCSPKCITEILNIFYTTMKITNTTVSFAQVLQLR